jgi:hypothetical protein
MIYFHSALKGKQSKNVFSAFTARWCSEFKFCCFDISVTPAYLGHERYAKLFAALSNDGRMPLLAANHSVRIKHGLSMP